MSVHDWKFHDFDMLLDMPVRVGSELLTYPVVYRMTGLQRGSFCLLLGDRETGFWLRKTKNEGMNGSVRYMGYPNLSAAMDAAIKWARRKDEEAAADLQRQEQKP